MTLIAHRILPQDKKLIRGQLKAMSTRITAGDDLNLGDHGKAISALQKHLSQAGTYRGPLDGKFNPALETAVKSFQAQKGLPQTGIVDRATYGAVKSVDLFVSGGFKGTPAHINQRGRDIKALESKLHELGYHTGKVDGLFDSATQHAVQLFEKKHHLKPNGVVGGRVATAVNHSLAAKHDHDFRKKVLDIARKHLGFHEKGVNGNPFSKYFGRGPEAWCADFVSYCYTKAGRKLNEYGTPHLLQLLHNNGTYHRHHPKPGDIVMFDWSPGSGEAASHTGLVEKTFKRNGQWYVQTIEGNSGDMVKRNVWPVNSSLIAGFGSVR